MLKSQILISFLIIFVLFSLPFYLDSNATTQYYVTITWTRPDTNPYATQIPTVTYVDNGKTITSSMGSGGAQIKIAVDSGSRVTFNSFYYDNFQRTPSPASQVINANTTIAVTYSQNAIPISSNPFSNAGNGVVLLAALGPYINLMTLQWFLGLLCIGICGALYLKSYNPWIPITLLLVFGGIFTYANGANGVQSLLPSQFNLITYILLGLGISGTVFQAFSNRG